MSKDYKIPLAIRFDSKERFDEFVSRSREIGLDVSDALNLGVEYFLQFAGRGTPCQENTQEGDHE